MKRTLDELLAAVNAIVGEDNTDNAVITLIEDITDTVNAVPEEKPDLQPEIDRLTAELDDFKRRYKARFLGEPVDDEPDIDVEEVKKIDEKNATDDREITTADIFTEKNNKKED